MLHLHTIVKRLAYLWFIHLLILLSCVVAQAALAQEKFNYLALNGDIYDDLGPYYFRAQGNANIAFMRLDLFAEKLGYSYNYDGLKVALKNNYRTIELKTTNNITLGFDKHPDVLTINGEFIESPMGVVVNDVAYGAVTPLAKAVGGQSGWEGDPGLVWILYDPKKDVPAPEPVQSTAQPAAPVESVEIQTSGGTLGSPRIALHEDNKTRVAIDLPANSFYEVYAHDKTLIVSLPQLGATPFTQNFPNDPNIENVRYALVDNKVSMVITTRYTLQAAGSGYTFALLPADETTGNERFYIDFSPSLAGTAVKSAEGMQPQDMSSAKMPTAHQKIVVIDAGHGAHDPGAVGYAVEKDVVLAIAVKLRAYLEAQGVQVMMTRSDDTFLELSERSTFATPEINLFVSVHANAATESASGIETWVFGQSLGQTNLARAIEENGGGEEGQALTQEARQIAQGITGVIYRESQLQYSLELAELVQGKMIAATGAKDRGVQKAEFYVIRNALSPAILVETGFVSNPDEGTKLTTDAYQDTMARAIADGIVQFLSSGNALAATQQQP